MIGIMRIVDEIVFEMDGSLVSLDIEEYEASINGDTLYYREGVWCERDEETGEWMPDWDLTWFYKDPENPEEYFYFEQDPPETALHNLRYYLIQNGS